MCVAMCVAGCVVFLFPFPVVNVRYWEINDKSGQMRFDKWKRSVEACQSVAAASPAGSLFSYVK